MRGFAAIAVAMSHYHWPLMPGGYLAVDLFFLLSGFVLAITYSAALHSGLSGMAFMRKRLVRLYPLYFAGTLAGALLAGSHFRHGIEPVALQDFLITLGANLAMVPNPLSQLMFPFNPASWSLFYELIANAVLAFSLAAMCRKRLIFVCLILGAALSAAAFYMSQQELARAVYANHAGIIAMGVNWDDWPVALLRTLFSFTLGIILAKFHDPTIRRISNWAMLVIVMMIACMQVRANFADRLGFDLAFVLVMAPVLVAMGMRLEPGPKTAAIFAILGEISYALYVIHLPILQIFSRISGLLGYAELPPVAVYLVTVLGLSWLVTRFYDLPLRRWLNGRFMAHKAP